MKNITSVYCVIETIESRPYVHILKNHKSAMVRIEKLMRDNSYPEEKIKEAVKEESFSDNEFSENGYGIYVQKTKIE